MEKQPRQQRHYASDPILPPAAATSTLPTLGIQSTARPWRAAIGIALVFLIVITFMPALTAGFVYWDDDDMIHNETRYRTLAWENVRWMLTTSYTGHFQPLTWLSFWADWNLWGLESFGYHLTNVLLHGFATIVFYSIALRLLSGAYGGSANTRGFLFDGQAAQSRGADSRSLCLCAGVTAAFFALHPLRVESVAWIAERRDVLSGCFYLLTILSYLRYVDRVQPGRPGPGLPSDRGGSAAGPFLAMHGFLILSLLSKASAVTMPFVLLIIDAYPLRRFRRPSSTGRAAWPGIVMEKLPMLIICLLAGIRALQAQMTQGALYPLSEHDLTARLAQACYGLTFYLRKTLWPVDLGPLYQLPMRAVLVQGLLWESLAYAGILLIITASSVKRAPAVTAALGFYSLQLAPVLGLVQSGPQLVADRYSYLPSLGLALLLGGGLMALSRRMLTQRARMVLIVCCALMVSGLMHVTFRQCDVWLSPLTLWRRAVEVSPNSSIAHVNYADALATAGAYFQAIEEYQKGLTLNPTDAIALRHLAKVLHMGRDHENAALLYRKAIALDPAFGPAYLQLARTLVATRKPLEAASILRTRLRQNPADTDTAFYLSDLLATHAEESVRDGKEAVLIARQLSARYHDSNGVALMLLASALAEAGEFEECHDVTDRAIRMAEEKGHQLLLEELQRRRRLFLAHEPFHRGD